MNGNDYIDGWADDLLNNPTADINNTGKGYELALFGHYLSSFIDIKGQDDPKESTIIKEIWEKIDNHRIMNGERVIINGYSEKVLLLAAE